MTATNPLLCWAWASTLVVCPLYGGSFLIIGLPLFSARHSSQAASSTPPFEEIDSPDEAVQVSLLSFTLTKVNASFYQGHDE